MEKIPDFAVGEEKGDEAEVLERPSFSADDYRERSDKIFDREFEDLSYEDSPVAEEIPVILAKIKKMVYARDVIPEVDFRDLVKDIFEKDKKLAVDIYKRACGAYRMASTDFAEGGSTAMNTRKRADLYRLDHN